MCSYIRAILLILVILPFAFAQRGGNAAREWPTYNHDLAATRYSPLSQINPSNVVRLKQAWVYRPSATGARPSAER